MAARLAGNQQLFGGTALAAWPPRGHAEGMTDFPDWQVPQAHATQIKSTGVPLISKSVLLNTPALESIAGDGSYTAPTVDIPGTGYEIVIIAQVPLATSSPFIEVMLNWIDSTSGVTVWRDYWIMPASEPDLFFEMHGHGPSKSDQVQVVINNLDTTNTASVEYYLLSNARTYTRDDWRWDNYANANVTVPGWTLPTLPHDQSVLGMVNNVAVAAGSTSTYLFGTYNGPVFLSLQLLTGSIGNLIVSVAPQPSSSYVSNNPTFSMVSPAAVQQIGGTRSPLRVILHNKGTSSLSVTMALTASG